MSIYTQACGVVVLSVLLVLFLINHSKIFLHTEKIFIATLTTSLVANVVDIVCQVILYDTFFSDELSRFACQLYQILLVMVLCLTVLYISKDIYEDNRKFLKYSWYFIAVFVVAAITIFILPEGISREPGKLYAYGESVWFTYGVALFYILSVCIIVNVMRHRINADRRTAINLWMILWLLAAVLEFIFPQIFMAGFATSMGVMIIYIKLENPGMNMDRESGMHSNNAFMEYLQQEYGNRKSFSMIVVVPASVKDSLYEHPVNMKRVSQILKSKSAIGFRKAQDEIALIFEDANAAAEWGKGFREQLENSTDEDEIALRNGYWIVIKDSQWFKDKEELLYFIKFAISNRHNHKGVKERNIVVVNENVVSEMRREKQIERMLDRALKEDRIEVFYQPIYSTEKKRFTTAEALVRIREKDGKIVSPGEFIPVAERNGKIIDVGNRVFRQVCKLISDEQISQYGIEYVEVNLSVAQCADRCLAENYIAAMEEHKVDPRGINLEITESASLEDKEVLLQNMQRLIEYGVNFSLDDFGTGQSNLNYIVDMPVDIVKFDRGMITSYFDNMKAKYVMDAAMGMIHGMGLKIVSEGIETGEQLGKMEELGISYIQGFYFSKPLEKVEFIKFLKERNG